MVASDRSRLSPAGRYRRAEGKRRPDDGYGGSLDESLSTATLSAAGLARAGQGPVPGYGSSGGAGHGNGVLMRSGGAAEA
jgi:hypothetical protein